MEAERLTFRSEILFAIGPRKIVVPDYQRAFSWESRQVELFLTDLAQYQEREKGNYYFGHFIVEEDLKNASQWKIVDGQQRITLFVLFLLVCRSVSEEALSSDAEKFLSHFSTVSYDRANFELIKQNLTHFFIEHPKLEEKKLADAEIKSGFSLQGTFTRSQRRMVISLLKIRKAFLAGDLSTKRINDYLGIILNADCSLHRTNDPSVAVNIFEMHNTRGVALSTLEIVKALLMKFVYDNDGAKEREGSVAEIQANFGEIYGMEEELAAGTFRGEMTMEQLLRLHLRVVDDGTLTAVGDYQAPALNADSAALLEHLKERLNYEDTEKTKKRSPAAGVVYAKKLTEELKKSVAIVTHLLPAWDGTERLVGDVLILDKELSTQFFLLICRDNLTSEAFTEPPLSRETLAMWEKLLFTRDFHHGYHGKSYRDDFPKLFERMGRTEDTIKSRLRARLKDGFRPGDTTKNLQTLVKEYLEASEKDILGSAYYWWRHKMIYALYKYEVQSVPAIRDTVKNTISVEHILPQGWEWEWLDDVDDEQTLEPSEKEQHLKEVGSYLHGLGNLLLLTPGQNASVSNTKPSEKSYLGFYSGGSYQWHEKNRERWEKSGQWGKLIEERGEEIYKFMLENLIEHSLLDSSSSKDETAS